jgi:hypothetical protein
MPVTGAGGLLWIPRHGRCLHPPEGGRSSHPRQLGIYGNGAPIKRELRLESCLSPTTIAPKPASWYPAFRLSPRP